MRSLATPRDPRVRPLRPPACAHTAARQPAADPEGEDRPVPFARVERFIEEAARNPSVAFIPPAEVERLAREESRDDDEAALRKLLPANVPTLVLILPVAGTFFTAEFSSLFGLLTVWFPACEGEPCKLWSAPFCGENAATHLFLRLKSLLEVRGEAVEKSFVAARAGTASRACCEKLCPVNWCRQCVTQWALTKASTLSGNRRN